MVRPEVVDVAGQVFIRRRALNQSQNSFLHELTQLRKRAVTIATSPCAGG